MSYVYVASPFSHPDLEVQRKRFYEAMRYTAWRIKEFGEVVYSPIVHCYEMALVHDFPGDADFWKRYDTIMLVPAAEMHVLQIEGWKESKGVQGEIELCRLLHKPIYRIIPQDDDYYRVLRMA